MSLVSLRELAISAGPFILLTVVLLWLAYLILDPTPPRKVVMATGSEQGAYAEFGKRYVAELARFGVKVELRSTAGAAENRRLLRDANSGVDIAFMQSGAGRRHLRDRRGQERARAGFAGQFIFGAGVGVLSH